MECKFWVGQNVVCINDDGCERWLQTGAVYQIREVVIGFTQGGQYAGAAPGLRLVGITQDLNEDGVQFSYDYRRFRPATDISTFQSIVAKVMNRKKVRA